MSRTLGVVTALVVVAFIIGCQQPQEAPSQQQARLLAAQDADLQKQLAARQAEIETLQQKHAKELRQRDLELLQCKARIDALQRDLEQGINERVKSVTATVMDENAKLRQEVEQLQAQIEKLKATPAQESK
jgi:DNA anti-recombination protein RmuC